MWESFFSLVHGHIKEALCLSWFFLAQGGSVYKICSKTRPGKTLGWASKAEPSKVIKLAQALPDAKNNKKNFPK
jgi:hypothetical protein